MTQGLYSDDDDLTPFFSLLAEAIILIVILITRMIDPLYSDDHPEKTLEWMKVVDSHFGRTQYRTAVICIQSQSVKESEEAVRKVVSQPCL